jgi:hypothetical protein
VKKIIIPLIILLYIIFLFFFKKEFTTDSDISKEQLKLKQSKQFNTFSNDIKEFNAAFKSATQIYEKLNKFTSKIISAKLGTAIQHFFENSFPKRIQPFGLYKKNTTSSSNFITIINQYSQLNNKDLIEMMNAIFDIISSNAVNNSIFDCDDSYNLDNNNYLSTYNNAIINYFNSRATREQHIQCTNIVYSSYLVCLSRR